MSTDWGTIKFTCYYCKAEMSKDMFKRYSLALKTRKGKCLKCHALKTKEYMAKKKDKVSNGDTNNNAQ